MIPDYTTGAFPEIVTDLYDKITETPSRYKDDTSAKHHQRCGSSKVIEGEFAGLFLKISSPSHTEKGFNTFRLTINNRPIFTLSRTTVGFNGTEITVSKDFEALNTSNALKIFYKFVEKLYFEHVAHKAHEDAIRRKEEEELLEENQKLLDEISLALTNLSMRRETELSGTLPHD